MRAVQRRDRYQVERSERHIELDPEHQHQLKYGGWSGECFRAGADCVHEHDHRNTKHRDHEIGHDTRKGDDDVSLLEIPVISGIHGDGLCTAEYRSVGEEQEERQNDRHERIDMLCRIPGEPAELVSGHVAVLEGCISVGVFMRDHGKQENGGNQNEVLQ